MILFVQDGCPFCERVKSTPGLLVAKVKMTATGSQITVDGNDLNSPVSLPGFPALLDGKDVYVGLSIIEERLKALGALK